MTSMADFLEELQTASITKPFFPFSNMELVNGYTGLNEIISENCSMEMVGCCNESMFNLSAVYPEFYADSQTSCLNSLMNTDAVVGNTDDGFQMHSPKRKRKSTSVKSESSDSVFTEEKTISKTNSGRRKRRKDADDGLVGGSKSCTENGGTEKAKEVIHVRARRGQATDSHSLAERVRREKINERMRCLQDLVPGCYKTMGMAVMLDEIINYVQSLQNQVEFLSMKLSAASTLSDFSTDHHQHQIGDVQQVRDVWHACSIDGVSATDGFVFTDYNAAFPL